MLERLRRGLAGPTLPMDPGPILNGGMSLMLYLKMGDCEDLFTYDRKLITLVKKKKRNSMQCLVRKIDHT